MNTDEMTVEEFIGWLTYHGTRTMGGADKRKVRVIRQGQDNVPLKYRVIFSPTEAIIVIED